MRVDEHFAEADALGREDLQQQLLRPLEVGGREAVGTEPVLVADHHEFEAGVAQLQQGGHHALDQAELGVAVHLLVGRFLDQHAVAVDEEDAGHAAASAAASAATTAAFSAGVPTLIRSASPNCGMARMSRTTMPAASRRESAASASSNRTSR